MFPIHEPPFVYALILDPARRGFSISRKKSNNYKRYDTKELGDTNQDREHRKLRTTSYLAASLNESAKGGS
jgi:hypothetical protein